jgi:hypothetical protein
VQAINDLLGHGSPWIVVEAFLGSHFGVLADFFAVEALMLAGLVRYLRGSRRFGRILFCTLTP